MRLGWQYYYRMGIYLCGYGGICAVIATPGTIILLNQGQTDIVLLWLLIAVMIFIGWMLIEYAKYNRLYLAWAEVLIEMNQRIHANDKIDKEQKV